MKLNPSLKTFWLTPSQIKVLQGGRMSSKSYDVAGVLLFMASKYDIRILCARRFQNKISESVYALLKAIILQDEYFKAIFRIYESSIKCTLTGAEFVFMGIQRSLDEIRGLNGINITWVEEANNLSEEQWNIIRPTILREEGSFCIMVFNPNLDTDFVYREFVLKKQDNVLVQKINYNENPFLSKSALDLIEADRNNLDEAEFNNMYLGIPRAESEDALIKREWLYLCIDAHKKINIEPTGKSFIGYDVADSGADSSATALRRGFLLTELKEWRAAEDELIKSSQKVYQDALKHDAIIQYDSIGVGAGVGSSIALFNAQNNTSIEAIKFNAGASVDRPESDYSPKIKNKDFFANLKAQSWWDFAEKIKKTYNAVKNNAEIDNDDIISFSSECKFLDELIVELSTPLKDFDANGKVKVESKKDLLKRGIKSPNLADSIIMCYYTKKSSGFKRVK
jgi:phage terminase large subunit